jgi:RNA polymerase sigma factor (sigma-70 family)
MPGADRPAHEALAELYAPLAPALHAWATLRLSARLRRELSPADLAQEVWLRALEVFGAWDARVSSFRAWLFAVAKRVLLEAQRRARRRESEQPAAGSSTRVFALQEVPLEVTSLTRRVAKDEQVQRFVARLHALDDKERMTAIHCGLEELSLAEAAERLGESYAATAKRWQRLRDEMRGWGVPLGLVADA